MQRSHRRDRTAGGVPSEPFAGRPNRSIAGPLRVRSTEACAPDLLA